MDDRRPDNQLRLAFAEEPAGEARPLAAQEVESSTASCEPERPVNSVPRTGHITDRTAVYGPVRRVVWEGPGRKARPYPDPRARAVGTMLPGIPESPSGAIPGSLQTLRIAVPPLPGPAASRPPIPTAHASSLPTSLVHCYPPGHGRPRGRSDKEVRVWVPGRELGWGLRRRTLERRN